MDICITIRSSQSILKCFFLLIHSVILLRCWSHLCFMAEEIDFQRGYGLAQGYTASGWQGKVHTSSVESAKRYLTNTTHDDENGQCQEPLSECKTLRKWFSFLMHYWQDFIFFFFTLSLFFSKISYLHLNMNDYWFFS